MSNSYLENHPFLIEPQDTGYLYYLTCISNLSSRRNATITQYPTVSGKSISDNMYLEPTTISFNINISSIYQTPNKYVTDDSKTLISLSAEEIKNLIKDWQSSAVRLNITTFEDSFTNMVIQNLSVSEASDLGTWNATLQLQEVRIAEVTEITLDFADSAAEEADGNEEQSLGADNGSTAAELSEMIGSVGTGALLGATIGSAIPVVGTGIGAVIGAAAGFFVYLFNQD